MKIVFLDASTLGGTSLAPIASLGELVTYPTSTAAEALLRVRDAEVLIINKVKVTDELLAAAPQLRLVCEAATGVNNIDLEAAARRGIPVRNVAGYSTDAVVQLTFTQILGLVTGPERFDRFVKDGSYTTHPIFTEVSQPFSELAGKTLGIIGMGTIGSRVARVAEAFGMKVIYYDKFRAAPEVEGLPIARIIPAWRSPNCCAARMSSASTRRSTSAPAA